MRSNENIQNQERNFQNSRTPTKTSLKREQRLREFNVRSQRKQGNGEKLMKFGNHFGSEDFTPNKKLGPSIGIMKLSMQLDQRNVQRHIGSNIELGNEPGQNSTKASFMRMNNQKSQEKIPKREKIDFSRKPSGHPRNMSTTIYDERRETEKELTRGKYIGGNSNDFNLNKVKINPITGVLSPLQIGKLSVY